MPNVRLAYMPLVTYPDLVPNESVAAAVALAVALGCELHVTTFSVEIPRVSSPVGGILLNIPEMIRTTEENSRAHCKALKEFVHRQADGSIKVECLSRELVPGLTGDSAAAEARYFDFSLLSWAKDMPVVLELAQAVVFGAGRPSVLVPPSATSAPIRHIAVAWDGSRVAARALADAMLLVTEDTRITVLTVRGEKELERHDIAQALASSLKNRGLQAQAQSVALAGRPIAEALQETALAAGAHLLVMGGFGHSRVRDFILGGATKGIFADLRIPVLLSH